MRLIPMCDLGDKQSTQEDVEGRWRPRQWDDGWETAIGGFFCEVTRCPEIAGWSWCVQNAATPAELIYAAGRTPVEIDAKRAALEVAQIYAERIRSRLRRRQ